MSEKIAGDGSTSFTPIYEADPPGEPRPASDIEPFVQQIKETADKLIRDHANRGDVKLLNTALKELRYAFKVFAAYRKHRKVTVFGSARTKPTHPAYLAAIEFGQRMAAHEYMVITGAACGIMEAGHVGAGKALSIGVNIMLPFEQSANSVIAGDPKLMNLKYFFTRKLLFVKESDAVVLFPGGFGTHDEGFEVLTLVQTGKSHLFPIVLLDQPGGKYWTSFERFIRESLLDEGYISPADPSLYKVTDSVDVAVQEITQFYRVYHSMRYVKNDLVLRLQKPLTDELLADLQNRFADIIASGGITQSGPLPDEANEADLAHLTRLRFRFDRHGHGRLRQMIDAINLA